MGITKRLDLSALDKELLNFFDPQQGDMQLALGLKKAISNWSVKEE